ncbi:unnamed protein product [Closterium sp. NIES-64]|nr:unnamed protein product [Closterium sp. NIES-64]
METRSGKRYERPPELAAMATLGWRAGEVTRSKKRTHAGETEDGARREAYTAPHRRHSMGDLPSEGRDARESLTGRPRVEATTGGSPSRAVNAQGEGGTDGELLGRLRRLSLSEHQVTEVARPGNVNRRPGSAGLRNEKDLEAQLLVLQARIRELEGSAHKETAMLAREEEEGSSEAEFVLVVRALRQREEIVLRSDQGERRELPAPRMHLASKQLEMEVEVGGPGDASVEEVRASQQRAEQRLLDLQVERQQQRERGWALMALEVLPARREAVAAGEPMSPNGTGVADTSMGQQEPGAGLEPEAETEGGGSTAAVRPAAEEDGAWEELGKYNGG